MRFVEVLVDRHRLSEKLGRSTDRRWKSKALRRNMLEWPNKLGWRLENLAGLNFRAIITNEIQGPKTKYVGMAKLVIKDHLDLFKCDLKSKDLNSII